MHELKELVDDSLQEAPVSSEKAGILTYHIHDVRRHNGFVVLASLLLNQS